MKRDTGQQITGLHLHSSRCVQDIHVEHLLPALFQISLSAYVLFEPKGRQVKRYISWCYVPFSNANCISKSRLRLNNANARMVKHICFSFLSSFLLMFAYARSAIFSTVSNYTNTPIQRRNNNCRQKRNENLMFICLAEILFCIWSLFVLWSCWQWNASSWSDGL